MNLIRWPEVETERMNDRLTRQVVHGELLTLARLHLAQGAEVPLHQHPNEQVTMLESGRLEFHFPDGVQVLAAGEAMRIPANVPHRVLAMEDSVATDLFAPTRQDWLRGDDAYLRR